MKRTACALLTLMIALAAFAPTLAERELPLAAAAFDPARFEKYASYRRDTQSGEWTVCANEAISALELFADQAGRYSDGIVYFYLEIAGNSHTGLITPILNVYYRGRGAGDAAAVSFRIGDTRYDFPVRAVPADLGGRGQTSLMRIPMEAEGLRMLRELDAAGSVAVRIHGDEQYTALCQPAKTYKNARDQVEALSIASLSPMLRELDAIGIDRYRLWDLGSAGRASISGSELPLRATAMGPSQAVRGIELDEAFNMLSPGAKGKSVTALQERLIALNYLAEKADGTYGKSTRTAVSNIQRLVGEIPTGSADRAFVDRLFEGEIAPVDTAPDKIAPVWDDLGGEARISVERYWFASAVTAQRGDAALARRAAANQDNLLIAFDGRVKNGGLTPLDLAWRLTATVTYEGVYAFPCQLACERDDGAAFGDSLIPLAESRLVLYAEIPRGIAGGGGAWTLTIAEGEARIEYPLGG